MQIENTAGLYFCKIAFNLIPTASSLDEGECKIHQVLAYYNRIQWQDVTECGHSQYEM